MIKNKWERTFRPPCTILKLANMEIQILLLTIPSISIIIPIPPRFLLRIQITSLQQIP